MNTSMEKTPSKKRKSLGGQKTPAKAAKLDESMKSPKNAKSPKPDSKSPANNVESNNVAQAKSPKKQIKPENKVTKSVNGVSPKLQKFKGTKVLEDIKMKKLQKKKDKRVKATQVAKKGFLLEKLQKRVEKEGKEAVIKSLNEKIDSIVSRAEMTKTSKRNLRNYKKMLNMVSEKELPTTKPDSKAAKNKKETPNNSAAAKTKEVKPKQNKKNDKSIQMVEKNEEDEPKEKKNKKVEDDDVETSFKDVKNAEFEDDSDDGEEEEESDDDKEASDEDEEEESDDEDDEEVPAKKAEPKKVIQNEDAKPKQENNDKSAKKSRYVLFIGNIAFDTTKDELKEHFKKVGEVIDVRIPTERESNRPRGFAYVELADEAAYQKSFDLDGSQLKNRKIRVQYSQAGNKNSEDQKKEIKAKNFKLHAMRKQQKGSPFKGQKGSPFKGQRGSPYQGPNRGSPFKGRNKN